MNQIINGDNLTIMHSMETCSVDLIYLDPPFFTQRDFDEFNDKWIDIHAYIDWMIPRLKEMHRILKPTGSIYLHCDWHAVHYLKVEMDRIFGTDNFRNEIVWHYTGNSVPKNSFPRKHDNILFYSKGDEITLKFNEILQPYSELTLKRYNHTDEKGKKYKISALKNGKQEVVYAKEGKYPDDVWDIPIVRSKKEKLGYPTQKPEALLERIIKASSNPGDVMFDPFCGCGTSAAVAQKMGRQYIGIDISPIACRIAEIRLGNQLSKIFKKELL